MQINSFALTLLTLYPLTALAANCGTIGGANQCVKFWTGSGCSGNAISYKPTCNGNCYQYDNVRSIQVRGNDVQGTNCVLYSDSRCQGYIGETGNKRGDGGCYVPPVPAYSMKCWFGC
ncbi:hypothetical protein TWF569_007745 [Orbilia oligospora]|uniref:Secreted protein n=1 Tax=Orbilia oligospora TaxID=2813651 RepID=A0A7C8PCS9_ORBOL|nr:hypothetical protein TWF706_000480 [Orbilia oligospora]KAF3137768.1 hypothetical protein TWF594_007422 [Orbilia oligospora]KAF3141979.1 hypothetical protein TWF569_007745 [Orbilia oligospora]KAF3144680.1 hypothetical protein TWF703_008666 [Orbilia oligospora]